jgi:hypothetical protein
MMFDKNPLVKKRLVKKPITMFGKKPFGKTTFGKKPFGKTTYGKHNVWYSDFW